MFSYAPLIVLFPLLGFLFLGLFGSRIKNEKLLGILGSGTVGLSFLVALGLFVAMLGMHPEERKHVRHRVLEHVPRQGPLQPVGLLKAAL